MLKLYFGNTIAVISTLLLAINLGYMLWGCMNHAAIQNWGGILLVFIILNGIYWYFANIRDVYSNSIVNAIDTSKEMGLFSAKSMQSILYWCASSMIWLAGILAIFKPEIRQSIFYFITVVAVLQILFIECSRIRLYGISPHRFDYM